MKAINDYIVVDVEKVGPKKVGGLLLTEELDETIGTLKLRLSLQVILVEGLKDKDIIYYDKHAGHGITWADTMYHVIRARDVVLVE